MPTLKLNYWDLSDQVLFVMKTTQNNNMNDHTSAIYVENETKLPCLIRPGAVYDESQITQRHHRSIGLVYTKIKTKLSGPIWPGAIHDEN